MNLTPNDNPHTLTLRRDDPEAPWLRMDAIVLTTDETWTPSGIEKPPVDRSYLAPYPDYVLYTRSYLEHILPDTVPEAHEITTTISTYQRSPPQGNTSPSASPSTPANPSATSPSASPT